MIVLLAILALLALGSVWISPGCESCGGAARGPAIGWIGAIYYAALTALASIIGPRRFVIDGIVAAFAGHAVLTGHLLAQGEFCWTCVIAMLLAGATAVISLALPQAGSMRHLAIGAVAALACQAAAPALSALTHPVASFRGLPASLRNDTAPQVKVVLLASPEGTEASTIRESLLLPLQAEFGNRVVVREFQGNGRSAPSILVFRACNDVVEFRSIPPYSSLRGRVLSRLETPPK